MKDKPKRIELNCLECGNKFSKIIDPNSNKVVKCPRCKSIEVDIQWGKK